MSRGTGNSQLGPSGFPNQTVCRVGVAVSPNSCHCGEPRSVHCSHARSTCAHSGVGPASRTRYRVVVSPPLTVAPEHLDQLGAAVRTGLDHLAG